MKNNEIMQAIEDAIPTLRFFQDYSPPCGLTKTLVELVHIAKYALETQSKLQQLLHGHSFPSLNLNRPDVREEFNHKLSEVKHGVEGGGDYKVMAVFIKQLEELVK